MSTDTPDAAPDTPTDTADTPTNANPATADTAGTPTDDSPATADTAHTTADTADTTTDAAADDATTDTRDREDSPDTGTRADSPADIAAGTQTITSLAAQLVPDARRGVFRPTSDATPAAIERIATAAGWRTAVADTTGVADKRAVIAAIKLALGFDGEVGLNLDALADVLTDVDAEPGTLLLWSGASDFATDDDDQYRHVLDVLRSRATAGGDQPGAFLTLLT